MGRASTSPARASWRTWPSRSGCTRWPSRTRVNAHQRPKLERYDDSLFLVLKTLWYVDAEDAVETGEINMFVGARLRRHRPARPGLRAALGAVATSSREAKVLTHGPSAVVYAVCDTVVDGYSEVVEALAGGRRRGGGVGLLPRPHQRLGPDLHPQAGDRRGAPGGDAAARADAEVRRRAPSTASHDEAAPFFRDVADHLTRAAEIVDSLDALLSTAFDAHLARISVQQNDDMRKISAGVGTGRRADPDRRHLRDELRPHARAGLDLRLPVRRWC